MGVLYARVSGAWVPITASQDEVFIGPDTPTDPTAELWYDTDAIQATPPSALPWNMPWGQVGGGIINVADQPGFDTVERAVSGYAATWTAVAGRLYRFSGNISTNQLSTAGYQILSAKIDGGASFTVASLLSVAVNNGGTVPLLRHLGTIAAGAHTIQLYLRTGSGNPGVLSTSQHPGHMLIDDVGPAVPQ